MVTIAWIVFILSFVGIASTVFYELPEVVENGKHGRLRQSAESFLSFLAQGISRLLTGLWHFILEAKDLTPHPQLNKIKLNQSVQKVKKIFRIRIRTSREEPGWLPEAVELSSEPKTQDQSPEARYLEMIKKNPVDLNAYENLARLYLEEKKYLEAAEIFRFLIKRDPQNDTYLSNLGFTLYFLGEYQQSVKAYDQALSINSKVPVRFVNLALSLKALDDFPKAIKALNEALKLDPRNPAYLMMLADFYVAVDNQIRAEETLSQILELEPTNKSAREKLMKLKI